MEKFTLSGQTESEKSGAEAFAATVAIKERRGAIDVAGHVNLCFDVGDSALDLIEVNSLDFVGGLKQVLDGLHWMKI